MRQRKQEVWAQRVEVSENHKEEIIYHAESGRPLSAWEEALAMPILAPLEVVTKLVTLGHGSIFLDRRASLQYWSQRIRESWNLLKEYKEEMLGHDKKEAFDRLKALQMECDDAWRVLKEAQQQAYEERQQAREAQQRAFEERQQTWRAKIEGEITELENRLSQEYAKLERRNNHLTTLQDKLNNARSDEYRDRVQDWISEEEDRISHIREKIGRIEGWISEKQSRL